MLTHLEQRRDYPTSASDYKLLEECGRGVSATVRASFSLFREPLLHHSKDGDAWKAGKMVIPFIEARHHAVNC